MEWIFAFFIKKGTGADTNRFYPKGRVKVRKNQNLL